MKHMVQVVMVILLTIATGRFAIAQNPINIRRTSQLNIITFDPSQPADTNFLISVGSNDREIRVYSTTPGASNIGRITIAGGGSTPIDLVIGNAPFSTSASVPLAASGGLNWRGLFVSGAAVRLNARINGALLDTVVAANIYTLTWEPFRHNFAGRSPTLGFKFLAWVLPPPAAFW